MHSGEITPALTVFFFSAGITISFTLVFEAMLLLPLTGDILSSAQIDTLLLRAKYDWQHVEV